MLYRQESSLFSLEHHKRSEYLVFHFSSPYIIKHVAGQQLKIVIKIFCTLNNVCVKAYKRRLVLIPLTD
jgi:hypothetical protein